MSDPRKKTGRNRTAWTRTFVFPWNLRPARTASQKLVGLERMAARYDRGMIWFYREGGPSGECRSRR